MKLTAIFNVKDSGLESDSNTDRNYPGRQVETLPCRIDAIGQVISVNPLCQRPVNLITIPQIPQNTFSGRSIFSVQFTRDKITEN